eukprot:5304775-Pyramimonas_sp.AAC.1
MQDALYRRAALPASTLRRKIASPPQSRAGRSACRPCQSRAPSCPSASGARPRHQCRLLGLFSIEAWTRPAPIRSKEF